MELLRGAEMCRKVLVPWLGSWCADPSSSQGDAISCGGTSSDVSWCDGIDLVAAAPRKP